MKILSNLKKISSHLYYQRHLSSLGVKFFSRFRTYAAVMELVDLVDSKSSAFGRVGSNPTCGTIDRTFFEQSSTKLRCHCDNFSSWLIRLVELET